MIIILDLTLSIIDTLIGSEHDCRKARMRGHECSEGGLPVTDTHAPIAVLGGTPLLRSALSMALTGADAGLRGVEVPDLPALLQIHRDGQPLSAVLWLVEGAGADLQQDTAALVAGLGDIPVVIVMPGASIAGVTRVLEAGAKGLVPHGESMRELIAALGFVIDGGVYIPAGALTAAPEPAVPARKSRGTVGGSAIDRLDTLTDRQRQIVEHVAAGMSNREIAEALDIREGTVKVHVARILEKLGVGNRLEAALAVAESRSRRDDIEGVPSSVTPARAARRR